jgi:hypothetical protein
MTPEDKYNLITNLIIDLLPTNAVVWRSYNNTNDFRKQYTWLATQSLTIRVEGLINGSRISLIGNTHKVSWDYNKGPGAKLYNMIRTKVDDAAKLSEQVKPLAMLDKAIDLLQGRKEDNK